LVDGFAGEEKTLGQSLLVAFEEPIVSHCVLAVAVEMSSMRFCTLVLQRRCWLFERLLAVRMMPGVKLKLTASELDVPFLVVAFDLDVVAHCAEDVFEDSQPQLWWQT
jgi:hypothetical protein